MKRSTVSVGILLIGLSAVAAGSTITGRVTDYHGTTPLAGVEIRGLDYYATDPAVLTTMTGADGSYSLDVPDAYYLLTAAPVGESRFVPQYYNYASILDYATVLDCNGVSPTEVNFFLLSGYRLEATVTQGGSPAGGAYLSIWDPTTGYYSYGLNGVQTDLTSGRAVARIPQGTYWVTAYPADGFGFGLTGEPVVVNDDAQVTVAIAEPGTIAGTVRLEGGEPLPGIGVTAIDQRTGFAFAHTTTDAQGGYWMEGLVPERDYLLLARTRFHEEYLYWTVPGAFYPEAFSVAQAGTVSMAPGAVAFNSDITCPTQGGTIQGRVTDDSGTPLEGVLVYDFYRSSGLNDVIAYNQRFWYTDADGQYELAGLSAAPLGVVAVPSTEHRAQIYDGCDRTGTLIEGETLTVFPGDTLFDIDFQLTSTSQGGDGPLVTALSPHLIHPGNQRTIVLTGSGFDPGARIDLLPMLTLEEIGPVPTLENILIESGRIELELAMAGEAGFGSWEILITNPDGQYSYAYLTVIPQQPAPEMGLSAAPERFGPGSTMSVGINLSNWSGASATVDAYLALVLPGGSYYFFDGITFTGDAAPLAAGLVLAPELFVADSLLLSIPLEGALPAGSYIWYAALVDPSNGSVVDLAERVLQTP